MGVGVARRVEWARGKDKTRMASQVIGEYPCIQSEDTDSAL